MVIGSERARGLTKSQPEEPQRGRTRASQRRSKGRKVGMRVPRKVASAVARAQKRGPYSVPMIRNVGEVGRGTAVLRAGPRGAGP